MYIYAAASYAIIRRQAIIWINIDRLSIKYLEIYFNERSFEIQQKLSMKLHSKIQSAKWWPFGFGLNVFTYASYHY